MRKKFLALLLGLAVAMTGVAVPAHAAEATDVDIYEVFPDYEMQDYVSANFDKDADGYLSKEEIEDATVLDLADNWYLTDVTGIEYLTSLKKIDLTWVWVDAVDVTKLTQLEELILNGTAIEEIDLSNCKELKTLDVQLTYLADLDLSANTKLENLVMSVTDIAEIDLSNNKELVSFEAEDTPLTAIDFSNNTKLENVNLKKTKVTSADLSKLSELKTLKAGESKLETVDVSNNAKLEKLDLLAAANVKSLDVSKNTALKYLEISGTALTALDLSANTALQELYNYNRTVSFKDYSAAPVKDLDFSNNTALKKLYLDGTNLEHMKELDLAKYSVLTQLSLEETGLKAVKFNDETTYEKVYLTGNQLLSVELPKNVTEKATVEIGAQACTVKVPSTDTLETFDLNSLVDITRVKSVSGDVEYNEETGVVTFKGDNKEFAYKFLLTPDRVMDVTITVEKKTVEEEAAEKLAADKAAALPVVDMIAALGDITLESEEAIATAREAYEALTEDQKQHVSNYETLTNAEEALAEAKKVAADKEAAQVVVDMIDALGDITLESEEAIAAAREAYEALTEDQKQYVENYDVLTDAEEALELLKAEADAEEDKDSDAVKTGDVAMILPYILVMAVALVAISKRRFNR